MDGLDDLREFSLKIGDVLVSIVDLRFEFTIDFLDKVFTDWEIMKKFFSLMSTCDEGCSYLIDECHMMGDVVLSHVTKKTPVFHSD